MPPKNLSIVVYLYKFIAVELGGQARIKVSKKLNKKEGSQLSYSLWKQAVECLGPTEGKFADEV